MGDGLRKEDLTLLMDVYKKQSDLNNQVIVQQQKLIGRMDVMIDIHKETCHNIDKLADKVNNQEKTVMEGFVKINENLGSDRKEGMKEHGEIKIKLYMAFGLMAVIILNLIALYLK